MKFIIISLLLSSCMFVPIYSIKDDEAQWIHNITGESPSVEISQKCRREANFKILGRYNSEPHDSSYFNKLYDIYKLEGKCLYNNNYIFKIKPFSVYCYRLEEICEAYKPYIRYF